MILVSLQTNQIFENSIANIQILTFKLGMKCGQIKKVLPTLTIFLFIY